MPHDPGSPVAWMQFAHSDLALARQEVGPGVLFETLYAVTFRYPGDEEPLTETEYHEAVRIAAAVVAWAEVEVQK